MKDYNYSTDVAHTAPPEDKVNLLNKPYRVSAFLLGALRKGPHEADEFYYVRAVNRIFVRHRVHYPVGNNCGDKAWREYDTNKDPSIWCHPYQTREILPQGADVLAEPKEVLLEISNNLGKAWTV